MKMSFKKAEKPVKKVGKPKKSGKHHVLEEKLKVMKHIER